MSTELSLRQRVMLAVGVVVSWLFIIFSGVIWAAASYGALQKLRLQAMYGGHAAVPEQWPYTIPGFEPVFYSIVIIWMLIIVGLIKTVDLPLAGRGRV